jgi:hypothetical protein
MQKLGDEKVPMGIMHFANNDRENNGSSPQYPALKDATFVFVNYDYFTNSKTVYYTDTTKENLSLVSSVDIILAKKYFKIS